MSLTIFSATCFPKLFSKFFQRITGNSVSIPVAHSLCTERKIKINAWLIPVKATPFKAAAISFNGNMSQFFYKFFFHNPFRGIQDGQKDLQDKFQPFQER